MVITPGAVQAARPKVDSRFDVLAASILTPSDSTTADSPLGGLVIVVEASHGIEPMSVSPTTMLIAVGMGRSTFPAVDYASIALWLCLIIPDLLSLQDDIYVEKLPAE